MRLRCRPLGEREIRNPLSQYDLRILQYPGDEQTSYATNKRHLLSAYSNLAISAEAIGKDLATSYFHEFQKLLKAYPEAASTTPEYELYYTSANYYLNIKDYMKFIEFSDSLINFSKQIPLYKEHVIAYVSAKAAAYDSLRMYKEAYETSKEYAVLQIPCVCKNSGRKWRISRSRKGRTSW